MASIGYISQKKSKQNLHFCVEYSSVKFTRASNDCIYLGETATYQLKMQRKRKPPSQPKVAIKMRFVSEGSTYRAEMVPHVPNRSTEEAAEEPALVTALSDVPCDEADSERPIIVIRAGRHQVLRFPATRCFHSPQGWKPRCF
ncbi:hypothetical protein CAPTEDRAFT_185717 [Capitella teleta]|uniref:Uncharacterized protein n=1 Tax=Capitella teleta TaxID=283909 RepID=R7UMB0_CAPTE|nr:hypothetical protein CAPTEDRAFT_185717 [Capitella teleta]|eukprot:ELU07664.1 hypothetical protein CAPTEDRAFT_185717 [Capitella teleta]